MQLAPILNATGPDHEPRQEAEQLSFGSSAMATQLFEKDVQDR